MKVFAPNSETARSRFWYFLHQMRKMKKTTGEIISVNEIREQNADVVKNFGIWIRYNSRSGTHNMYKEYRQLTLCAAVDQMYQELAGRHRCRARSIQIIRTSAIANDEVKRVAVMAYIPENEKGEAKEIKFPLTHRIVKTPRSHYKTFRAERTCTYYN